MKVLAEDVFRVRFYFGRTLLTLHRTVAITAFIFKIKEAQQEAMDLSHPPQYADLPPLIPEPVERMQVTPALAITPAPASSPKSPAIRPNQLDLGYPTRPARHLRPPSSPAVDSASQRSVSPGRIFLKGESLTTAFCKITVRFNPSVIISLTVSPLTYINSFF